jgi:hypothetical protein
MYAWIMDWHRIFARSGWIEEIAGLRSLWYEIFLIKATGNPYKSKRWTDPDGIPGLFVPRFKSYK